MKRHCSRFYSGVSAPPALPRFDLQDVNLVFDGDSITAASPGYTGLTVDDINADQRCVLATSKFAQGGNHLSDLVARGSTVDAAYQSGKNNILCVLIGANDLTGMDVPAWLTSFAAYIDARKLVFDKVAVLTIISHAGTGLNAIRNTANAGIRGFYPGHCSVIADTGAPTTIMGVDSSCEDTSLFVDGVHPTALGYGHMRDDLLPALRWLIGY